MTNTGMQHNMSGLGGVGGSGVAGMQQGQGMGGMNGAQPGMNLPGAQPGMNLPGVQPGMNLPGVQPEMNLPGAQPGMNVPGAQPAPAMDSVLQQLGMFFSQIGPAMNQQGAPQMFVQMGTSVEPPFGGHPFGGTAPTDFANMGNPAASQTATANPLGGTQTNPGNQGVPSTDSHTPGNL